MSNAFSCKILKGIFYSTKKPVKLDIFISMYVNTTKAAKLLEISSSRLRQLLQERRVKGAYKDLENNRQYRQSQNQKQHQKK